MNGELIVKLSLLIDLFKFFIVKGELEGVPGVPQAVLGQGRAAAALVETVPHLRQAVSRLLKAVPRGPDAVAVSNAAAGDAGGVGRGWRRRRRRWRRIERPFEGRVICTGGGGSAVRGSR